MKIFLIMNFILFFQEAVATCDGYKNIPVSYAKNLLISKREPNSWLIEIKRPWQNRSDRYQISPVRDGGCDALWIKGPITRLALSSTTSVAYLDLLGGVDLIVAYPNINYVSNSNFMSRYRDNKIMELNYPPSLEKLITLKPDLFLSFAATVEDVGNLNRLWSFGIPLIFEADFMEKDPLGRAEWIKFYGLLIGKYEESQKIFNTIVDRFEALKKNVAINITPSKRKKILLGRTYGNNWQAPSASSDFAQMVSFAGGDYLFSNRDSKTVMNVLNFEEVLKEIDKTSVWIPLYGHKSRSDLKLDDHRLSVALSRKEIKIFDISKGLNGTGGNDYWETATVRPDLLLEELISIFHPEISEKNRVENRRWFLELK